MIDGRLNKEQLGGRDFKRDLEAELLASVRQMKAGQVGAVHQVKERDDVLKDVFRTAA